MTIKKILSIHNYLNIEKLKVINKKKKKKKAIINILNII